MPEAENSRATFKIHIYDISPTIYSYSAWQTIFGTLIVSYIIYKRIRKRGKKDRGRINKKLFIQTYVIILIEIFHL